MGPEAVSAILARSGLAAGGRSAAVFLRQDGTQGRVDRAAELDQEAPIPEQVPLVVQVSRWDRLKDPAGVLRCFAERCRHPTAHLLLAGPSVAEVADDPEGAQVVAEVRAQRATLGAELGERVHLASLPMDDLEENAAIVNAIQRRADVIVQKSLAEGFGLTVAEAMWKSRPVVASRIGGIQDQIVDGESGMSGRPVRPPVDRRSDRRAPRRPGAGTGGGAAARGRVRASFLGTRHLVQTWSCSRRCWPARITAREMRVAVDRGRAGAVLAACVRCAGRAASVTHRRPSATLRTVSPYYPRLIESRLSSSASRFDMNSTRDRSAHSRQLGARSQRRCCGHSGCPAPSVEFALPRMPRQLDCGQSGSGLGSPHGSHDASSVLRLPPEQPSDDGASGGSPRP